METPPLVLPGHLAGGPSRPRRRPHFDTLAARAKKLHTGVSRDLARIKLLIGEADGLPDWRVLVPLVRRAQARQRKLLRVVEQLRRPPRPSIGLDGAGPTRGRAVDRILFAVAEQLKGLTVRQT